MEARKTVVLDEPIVVRGRSINIKDTDFVASSMTRAVAATVRKHVSAAPANRRKRRLLNRESAIRRSLVGAKGMR